MAYRLLLAYAFVRPESEQNSSYPTFPRAPQSRRSGSPTFSPVGSAIGVASIKYAELESSLVFYSIRHVEGVGPSPFPH
jgi:hypothetical protein